MQNNDNQQATPPARKCTDLSYLIISSAYLIGLVIYAIICFNAQKLYDLSMPRDALGNTCWDSDHNQYQMVRISGPSISDRKCVEICEPEEINWSLGGLCMSSKVEKILRDSGDYQRYVQPKINSLSRIKILCLTLAVCVGLAILLNFFYQIVLFCCNSNPFSNFILILSLLASGAVLYFMYFVVNFWFWLSLVICAGFYLVYIVVWKIARGDYGLRKVNGQHSQNIRTNMCFRLLLTLACTILSISLTILTTLQYLSFISSSPYYIWKPPNLYAESKGLTHRQILLIVQFIYIISFMSTLHQYLISSLHTNRLGCGDMMFRLICCHIGSVCKLAMVRVLFGIPIFLLTLVKPLQDQKCADCCHCMCGLLLNLSRKYSLPIFSYQTCMKQCLNLSESADKLHYESHINNYQFNEGYIQKIAILVTIGCAAFATVYLSEIQLGLPISHFTLIISAILAVWISSFFASSWIYAKQAEDVRKICYNNRTQILI